MSLEEICKICGILFFISLFWYFIFVVFKSNNEFLKSLVGLNKNNVENFEPSEVTKFENEEKKIDNLIASKQKAIAVGEGTKSEHRELMKRIIEKKIKMMKMASVHSAATLDKLDEAVKGIEAIKFLEKSLEYYDEAIEQSDDL